MRAQKFVYAYLRTLFICIDFLGSFFGKKISSYLFSICRAQQNNSKQTVKLKDDGDQSLILHTPNPICTYRANTFCTKEPETLDWIRSFGGIGAFFDVGANVGIFSLFHAKLFDQKVYAFEPYSENVKMIHLSKEVNKFTQLEIIPMAALQKDTMKH